MGNRKAKANYRRAVLRLPDLDHSKVAVLNSLASPGSRRVYQSICNRTVHCLVLLGTASGFQSSGGRSPPHAPRSPRIGSQYDQPTARCGSATGP
jgi:hypothetical protein